MIKILRVLVAPFFWMFFPIKLIGRKNFPKKKKCVFIMNHLSAADPVLVLKAISTDIHFLGKKEIQDTKFRNWFFRHMHLIPVDRENVSMESMRECVGVLKADRALGIFPEGTRNRKTREILPLKDGVALFALLGKAPIVPAAMFKRPKIFRKSHIMIGESFELTEFYGKKPDKEILALATARIREEMLKIQRQLDEYMLAKGKKLPEAKA